MLLYQKMQLFDYQNYIGDEIKILQYDQSIDNHVWSNTKW